MTVLKTPSHPKTSSIPNIPRNSQEASQSKEGEVKKGGKKIVIDISKETKETRERKEIKDQKNQKAPERPKIIILEKSLKIGASTPISNSSAAGELKVLSSEGKEEKKKPRIVIKVRIGAELKPKGTKRYSSIDPGGKNYAIYIDQRTQGEKPKILAWEKWSMFEEKQKVIFSLPAMKLLTENLDSLLPLLSTSDEVLIEIQVRRNKQMIKIEQHTLTYLQLRLPPSVKIILVPNKWKYTLLGCPKGLTPYKRKRWSVKKAKEIFEERGQTDEIEFLNDQDKDDDFAETFTTLEAYLKKKGRS